MEKIPSFLSGIQEFGLLLDKSWTRLLKSPCINKGPSDAEQLASNYRLQSTLSPLRVVITKSQIFLRIRYGKFIDCGTGLIADGKLDTSLCVYIWR
jgi:hypothetical protein